MGRNMPREERERRYVAEWLLKTYPQGNFQTNVALGPIPVEITARHGLMAGAKLFQPSRPRIDGVVWLPHLYLLVEGKIREAKMAIGDLLVYKALAERSPDLPSYEGQPFRLTLVVPWALDWVKQAAQANEMDLQIFLPPWVEDYVRERQNYFTREVRLARDEKMRLRRTFGLE